MQKHIKDILKEDLNKENKRFKPRISRKSQKLNRTVNIDDSLYQDAIRRRKDKNMI